MIDPADLQAFLAKVEAGTIAVDLFKIGQNHHLQSVASGGKGSKHGSNFRVALDIEDCLDRFYGGYYSDWACGGQWNRAYQFVQLLTNAFTKAHVEVIVFFDGTLKKNKKLTFERNDFRQKTISVLKHIRMIGTPPPKIWWLPPSGIRTTLRNALRSISIQVAQTVNDHTMEIIEYFHEHKLDAIVGLHPDYIVSHTWRYFSSHDLRLSYKGALETKEFMVSRLLASLSLTADHLPFVAVFLGGYILIDEVKLKTIHECLKIDGSLDFEARIRKIAEIVRNSPTTDIDEFIKHLGLAEFENEIKESVEYYQRKGKFSMKFNQRGGKRRDAHKVVTVEPAPFASETNDDDEYAKKILTDVNTLVDEEASAIETVGEGKSKTENKDSTIKKTSQFVYTIPGEVIKTSLNRHQRGIMDSRIYQLLTKKEIILPQILEDELYREIPSVHLFYRPARQMIYAILFNLFHQKYLYSKRNSGNGSDKKNEKGKDKKDNQSVQKPPEICIAEWIWSPTNDYKKPDIVSAISLPWAVPTIQRLWFGMAYEDKQRRMKAFLTIMRSDSPLMLNRGYVPQHMLVMACVLRYIVTSPDRNILTRQELDAFLATAFSPQLPHVEYTQELVLPGVHLRGVYLATLFMQGVETASLANDSCGVPLPWTMTNPWLFFDGKLFHLKLKMSTIVTTLRELCDDHIEIVLKIERFRKAILEDVEHYLLPAAHMDPMFRPGFLPPPTLPVTFNKTTSFPLATTSTTANNAIYCPPSYFSLTPALLGRETITGVNPAAITIRHNNKNGILKWNNQKKGYQIKVGGIVTGSWAAGGGTHRTPFGPPGSRLGSRVTAEHLLRPDDPIHTNPITSRLVSTARSGVRAYTANKLNANKRNRQKRKEQRKAIKKDKKELITTNKDEQQPSQKENEAVNDNSDKKTTTKTEMDDVSEKFKALSTSLSKLELQNGRAPHVLKLSSLLGDEILKDDSEELPNLESTVSLLSANNESTSSLELQNDIDGASCNVPSSPTITTTETDSVIATETTVTPSSLVSDGVETSLTTDDATENAAKTQGNMIATPTIKNHGKTGSGKKTKAKKNGVGVKTTNSTESDSGITVDDIGQGSDVSVKG